MTHFQILDLPCLKFISCHYPWGNHPQNVLTFKPKSLVTRPLKPGIDGKLMFVWGRMYRANCSKQNRSGYNFVGIDTKQCYTFRLHSCFFVSLKLTKLAASAVSCFRWKLTSVSTMPGCIQFDVTGIPNDLQRRASSWENKALANFDCP